MQWAEFTSYATIDQEGHVNKSHHREVSYHWENKFFKNHKDRKNLPRWAEVLPPSVILKTKKTALGGVDRYKAQLVVHGNLQSFIYAIIVFSPVACIALVRILLSTSAAFSLTMNQLDVKGALLHVKPSVTDVVRAKLPSIDGVS